MHAEDWLAGIGVKGFNPSINDLRELATTSLRCSHRDCSVRRKTMETSIKLLRSHGLVLGWSSRHYSGLLALEGSCFGVADNLSEVAASPMKTEVGRDLANELSG